MKFGFSDPKKPPMQLEKVWDENIFLKILIFVEFSERKKTILMKMNPPGSFSTEGKKKISKRGSGWGVTPLEKLGKERKKISHGGFADQMDLGRKEKNLKRGFGVQENRRTRRGGKKSKGGKGVRG